jgi:hypothetical protein
MHNYEKSRTANVARQIYHIFEVNKKKRQLLSANWFLSQLGGCPVTIAKARQALGVTSKKVAGRFCWFFPKATRSRSREDILRKALEKLSHGSRSNLYKLHQDRRDEDINAYATQLQIVFQANNYRMSAKEALEEMKHSGFPKTKYIYPAKKAIGVRTFVAANNGTRYWVWTGEVGEQENEVQSWLTNKLRHGPMPREMLLKQASKIGWHESVVFDARQRCGGSMVRGETGSIIDIRKGQNEIYWYDRNSASNQIALDQEGRERLVGDTVNTQEKPRVPLIPAVKPGLSPKIKKAIIPGLEVEI